jgi:hypothetical protein
MPRSQAFVSAILDRHRDEIVRDFGAIGSGVGKRRLEDADYLIVVYLREPRPHPAAPVSIEGIPVEFVVTGEIRKFQGGRDRDVR